MVYGDLEDDELLEQIPWQSARCIVCTIPNYEHNTQLIRNLRKHKFEGRIYLTATTEKDLEQLSTCGADGVLYPHKMAAYNFYNAILKGLLNKPE